MFGCFNETSAEFFICMQASGRFKYISQSMYTYKLGVISQIFAQFLIYTDKEAHRTIGLKHVYSYRKPFWLNVK